VGTLIQPRVVDRANRPQIRSYINSPDTITSTGADVTHTVTNTAKGNETIVFNHVCTGLIVRASDPRTIYGIRVIDKRDDSTVWTRNEVNGKEEAYNPRLFNMNGSYDIKMVDIVLAPGLSSESWTVRLDHE